MKTHSAYLFLLCTIFACNTYRKGLVPTGGLHVAAQNSILEFSNTSKFFQKDSIFSVWVHDPLYKMVLIESDDGNSKWVEGEPYEGIIAVSISANSNKIFLPDSLIVGERSAKIPTRYLEKDGKLFYWWDDDHPLTQEALDVFEKYDLLLENDLNGLIEFYESDIDDRKKGVDYYICKNDFVNFKKVSTNKAIGFYIPPMLNCNQ